MKNILKKSVIILGVLSVTAIGCTKEGGPQTPPCGNIQVLTDEVIVGKQFPKGLYQINVFEMPCDEVMSDTGLFNRFLLLGDNDTLPSTWSYLEDAVGAHKFVDDTGAGFRAQRIGD